MNKNYNLQRVLNFLQDFGCATEEQLQKLFGCNKSDFKDILSSNTVSKKKNIYVHNTRTVDNKMIAALHVLEEYKDIYTDFYLGNEPVYISFICKDTSYNILVSDKDNQEGIVKRLNNSPLKFSYADKYVLLFKDTSMLEKIKFSKPYLYCTYMPVKIIER